MTVKYIKGNHRDFYLISRTHIKLVIIQKGKSLPGMYQWLILPSWKAKYTHFPSSCVPERLQATCFQRWKGLSLWKPTLSLLALLPSLLFCPQGHPELNSPGAVGPSSQKMTTSPLQWTFLRWPQASLSHIAATASLPGTWRLTLPISCLASTHQAMTSALVSKSWAAAFTHPSVHCRGHLSIWWHLPWSVKIILTGQSLKVSGESSILDCFLWAGSLLLLLLMIDCYLKYEESLICEEHQGFHLQQCPVTRGPRSWSVLWFHTAPNFLHIHLVNICAWEGTQAVQSLLWKPERLISHQVGTGSSVHSCNPPINPRKNIK